jgi:hypothetical protein
MAIDAGIYSLAGRGVKSVAEYDAEASQAKQNKLAEMMGGMKMDEAKRGLAGENALAQLLAGGKSGADVATGLASQGFGNQSMAYTKQLGELAKQKASTEKDQIAATVQKLSLGAQILGGAKDQGSYDAARATAQANGLDVSRMPPQFDPAFVAQKLQEGQTVKEQLEQKWKAMEYSTPNANSVLSAQTQATGQQIQREGQQIQIRGQDKTDQRAREFNATKVEENQLKRETTGNGAKPMPATALKMQQTSLDAINIASNTQADLGAIESQIASGKLKFGPLSNLANRGLNATGLSTEESRNFSSFKSSLETLRNNSLRLNSGVQTDGDAQRAWNELFENINDTDVVKQRLAEIKKLNERAVVQHKLNVDGIRSNYGHEPMDTSKYETQGAAVGAGSPKIIKDKAAFDALPSGTTYTAPDGSVRRKP